MPNDRLCMDCCFWERERHELSGLCRRYAPTVRSRSDDPKVKSFDLWPTTSEGDWCGEYRPVEAHVDGWRDEMRRMIADIHTRIA